MRAMEVFDKTVESLTNAGVAVILNNHISDAMWCCSSTDGNGLWHNKNYSAYDWKNAVIEMSVRYSENPLVIGNDLRNEIRDDIKNALRETWGSGNVKTDWKLAATDCANFLLMKVPDQLIFIEGLNYANNMSVIREKPIELDVTDKLVYSFHLYSWQNVTSYDNYSDFVAGLDKEVAYILEEGHPYTAPLWLGEFGQNTDDNYWDFTIRWLEENPSVGFAYWAWNGYQHTPADEESYGIMNSDMSTVRHEWKLQDLQSI